MSYLSRDARVRLTRNAQAANSQRAGGSDMPARLRRNAEAELLAAQRVGRGQEVDADGRNQVRIDKTLSVDERNRHRVNPDNLRFATPVEGSQAATKDYVDSLVVLGDSEFVVENAATGTAATTAWVAIDQGFLYQHNVIVAPGVSGSVFAQVTHTGTGDECVYLAPGYAYAVALSVRCYTQSFRINLSYAGTLSQTFWSSENRSERFASSNVDLTVYAILDNTSGAFTYIVPRFRRYNTGTANLSTSRMHIRRLLPHYEGGYQTAASPGLPDAPVADFEADNTSVAARAYILFGNTTTGTVTSYAWTFGDGTTSTAESPSKAYASAGTYTVSLTATGPGGNDTETKTSYITVT